MTKDAALVVVLLALFAALRAIPERPRNGGLAPHTDDKTRLPRGRGPGTAAQRRRQKPSQQVASHTSARTSTTHD